MPERIQMSRQKPWRADNPDAVIVARPTMWGNPVKVGIPGGCRTNAEAVDRFRDLLVTGALGLVYGVTIEAVREHLAGHDLACWCSLNDPCHADVLLELANSTD